MQGNERRSMRMKIVGTSASLVAGALATVPGTAAAAMPHVVQPGETLWSIAASNNLTTRTVAVFNGLSEDANVVAGATINVPTVSEGAAALAAAGATATPASSPAPASAPAAGSHTVAPGESLSSVAAANGITREALASANGLGADSYLLIGQSIAIPSASSSSTAGMGHIPSPSGELHLDPAAANSWNAMRQDSIANHGVDLYPAGPVSAYRTPEQQAELYQLYLSGQGAPANPPGTSTHESGLSVDLADPSMRAIVDVIGGGYGWYGTIPSEWWHVAFGG